MRQQHAFFGGAFFCALFCSGGPRGGARTREKVPPTPSISLPIIICPPPPFPALSREMQLPFGVKRSPLDFAFLRRSRLSPPFTASMIDLRGRSPWRSIRDARMRAQSLRTSLSDTHSVRTRRHAVENASGSIAQGVIGAMMSQTRSAVKASSTVDIPAFLHDARVEKRYSVLQICGHISSFLSSFFCCSCRVLSYISIALDAGRFFPARKSAPPQGYDS